ncbi:MAG: T9SS type A sorting domain-containing protein, partial [Bacteroidota bacterium]
VFDSKGRAHLTYLTVLLEFPSFQSTMALRYAYSDDGGATWTESEQLIDTGGIDPLNPINSERLVDKEWLAVDRNPDSEHFDDIYMQYVSFEPDTLDNVNAKILMVKKEAGADVFADNIVQVNTQEYILAQYSSLAVDNQGHVHAFFMGVTPDETTSFYHSVSTDGGQTFSPENKISDFHLPGMAIDEPTNAIPGIDSTRIYPCPHMRVDNSGGDTDGFLYAVWTANGISEASTPGVDIYFSKSTDGGATWSEPRVLNDNPDTESHQFFPSLHVNNRGVVIATWYDRRDDPDGLNTHYYITYSYDGGESFETSFAVSTQPSDFEMIGEKNGGFGIGEYTQVIANDDYAIPVWSDGRSNDGNIELYIAFIPIRDEVLGFDEVKTLSPGFSVVGPNPNPVYESAILKLDLHKAANLHFDIHSPDGKLVRRTPVKSFPAGTSTYVLNTSELAAGMYTLSIRSELGFVSKRFVVR